MSDRFIHYLPVLCATDVEPFRGHSKESGIQKTVFQTPDSARLKDVVTNHRLHHRVRRQMREQRYNKNNTASVEYITLQECNDNTARLVYAAGSARCINRLLRPAVVI
jgi:hypothetical protein